MRMKINILSCLNIRIATNLRHFNPNNFKIFPLSAKNKGRSLLNILKFINILYDYMNFTYEPGTGRTLTLCFTELTV